MLLHHFLASPTNNLSTTFRHQDYSPLKENVLVTLVFSKLWPNQLIPIIVEIVGACWKLLYYQGNEARRRNNHHQNQLTVIPCIWRPVFNLTCVCLLYYRTSLTSCPNHKNKLGWNLSVYFGFPRGVINGHRPKNL